MSYDLIFLRREPGQTWEQALGAFEVDDADAEFDQTDVEEFDEAEVDDEDDIPSVDPQVWRLISEGIRQINPSIEEDADELIDEASIQISCWADEACVSVPYWYSGQEARAVVTRMFEYAEVIEKVTGLECYDPQLELPLAEAKGNVDAAVVSFDQVADLFRDRGISTGH